jgi:chemotaxis protein MotA
MDLATIIGLMLGLVAIVGGHVLEGGGIHALIQPTAAMIVVGGTVGATFVSFPLPVILKAFKDLRLAFFPPHHDLLQLIGELCAYASKARTNGLIALEQDVKEAKDPFLGLGLAMIIDGVDPQKFRETLEVEMETFEAYNKTSAEYFESAGGFAPTIGIIGAVLGLIHVMENLSDPSKLGAGIAVAFVATIYGLITANILCIPLSTKLKHLLKEQLREKELIVEGLFLILFGENPRLIERKLHSYLAKRPNE